MGQGSYDERRHERHKKRTKEKEDSNYDRRYREYDRDREYDFEKVVKKHKRRRYHDDSHDSDSHQRRKPKRHRDDERKRHRKRDCEQSRTNKSSDTESERHLSSRRKKKDRKDRHPRKNEPKEKKKSKHDVTEPDNQKLHPLGDNYDSIPEKQLSVEENYFSHNSHFRFFLYRMKGGIHFEDLTSTEARVRFQDFCYDYNSGKLPKIFYDNDQIPEEAMKQCQRTQHVWSFQMEKSERQTLEIIKAGVHKQTEYSLSASSENVSRKK